MQNGVRFLIFSFLAMASAAFIGVNDLKAEYRYKDRKPDQVKALGTETLIEAMHSLKLDCESQAERFQIEQAHLQISGPFCDKQHSQVSISNMTNGFEGTTFAVNGTQFVSDYLYLDPGANQLRITYGSGSRQQVQDLVVFRTSKQPAN